MTTFDKRYLGVLLVDDNEPFRRRVASLLQKSASLTILGEAGDGEEAVRLARELRPDIVVIDIVMPRLNGIDATRRIKAECPSIAVIALSMYGDDGFRRAMRDAGAAAYVLKDSVSSELTGILTDIAAQLQDKQRQALPAQH